MAIFIQLMVYYIFKENGKQKVYQIMCKDPDYNTEYNDLEKRHTGWKYGVVFYGQAICFTLVCNFMYWTPYR